MIAKPTQGSRVGDIAVYLHGQGKANEHEYRDDPTRVRGGQVIGGTSAISVFDFGHADLRPAISDFVRLASRQFRMDHALETALIEGYGTDPRDPAPRRRERIRQAIGTAV